MSDKDDSDDNEIRLAGITKISVIQRISGIPGIGIQRILEIPRKKTGIPKILGMPWMWISGIPRRSELPRISGISRILDNKDTMDIRYTEDIGDT